MISKNNRIDNPSIDCCTNVLPNIVCTINPINPNPLISPTVDSTTV
jgi:hypothetical protein